MRRFLVLLLATALALTSVAQELPPRDFLEQLRRPLEQEAWGEATGRLVSSRKGKPKIEGTLRLKVSFTSEAMYAQLTLNENNFYGLEMMRDTVGKTAQHLDLPEDEVAPGLFEFGVRPEDLSFAFIFWDFVEELPRSSSRWQKCRVLKLISPDGKETVNVCSRRRTASQWRRNGIASAKGSPGANSSSRGRNDSRTDSGSSRKCNSPETAGRPPSNSISRTRRSSDGSPGLHRSPIRPNEGKHRY